MGNWLKLGPVAVRTGSKHLAKWGYDRVQIGGLGLWSRCSDGSRTLAAYHPRGCPTWHWSVSLTRRQPGLKRVFSFAAKRFRRSQWHDYVKLPFGWALCISRQDYHKQTRRG